MTVRNMRIVMIPMRQPDQEPILAGRVSGKRAAVRVLEHLSGTSEATLIALDFSGVELATASFLDEAVLRLRDHLRLSRSPTYLLVANLSGTVAEELDDLLVRAGDALLCGRLADDHLVTDVRLLGNLESKLKETFELVSKKGETSATELHAESNEEVQPTAWNNRLNALVAKSLLMEIPLGRAKKFRTIVEAN
jgi:hypothetical protein